MVLTFTQRYRMKRLFIIIILLALNAIQLQAKDQIAPLHRWYLTSGMDGAIFSTSTIQDNQLHPGVWSDKNVPRFTLFFNVGSMLQYNINRYFGLFTGLNMKNIGYIDQTDGYTLKRRVYTVGVPLAVKIGNMKMNHRGYAFMGGGVDFPFNYKEKQFQVRNEKTKFNEWFSNRTPSTMPYFCFGVVNRKGISLKLQHYTNNFLNTSYTNKGVQPYAGLDVHITMLSIGFVINHKRHNQFPEMNETLPPASVSML